MIRIACLAVAVLSLCACAASKNQAAGKYDEECASNAPCAAGLLCINSLCTLACTMQSQCQGLGPNASCSAGYCYDLCVDTRNCPNGLVCTMQISTQGTCRPK